MGVGHWVIGGGLLTSLQPLALPISTRSDRFLTLQSARLSFCNGVGNCRACRNNYHRNCMIHRCIPLHSSNIECYSIHYNYTWLVSNFLIFRDQDYQQGLRFTTVRYLVSCGCQNFRSKISLLKPESDINQTNHHRHLDEWTNHRRERLTRVDAKHSNCYRDG
jgi:hypothetical protein